MSPPTELPLVRVVQPGAPSRHRDAGWLRAARRARWLAYVSLVWMLVEGVLGIIAGAQARSIAVIAWAIGSAVEAAAAVIIIVRFTGRNRFSRTAERHAQRWVAASFLVLLPYILYEALVRLIHGSQPESNGLAVALLVSSIVLMPALGWAKHRLGAASRVECDGGRGDAEPALRRPGSGWADRAARGQRRRRIP